MDIDKMLNVNHNERLKNRQLSKGLDEHFKFLYDTFGVNKQINVGKAVITFHELIEEFVYLEPNTHNHMIIKNNKLNIMISFGTKYLLISSNLHDKHYSKFGIEVSGRRAINPINLYLSCKTLKILTDFRNLKKDIHKLRLVERLNKQLKVNQEKRVVKKI